MSQKFNALTLYEWGPFRRSWGVFRRCFGLRKFWGEFYNCGFDIILTVLWVELVPVVQVRHHAAHDFEAVGAECPAPVVECIDAAAGGV